MIEEERRELDEIATEEREAFFQQLRTEIAAAAANVEPAQSSVICHPGFEPGSAFSLDAEEGRCRIKSGMTTIATFPAHP
jgi:competence protein ComGF